jgi:D-alanyl-D-alanine carboxypeptidase
MSLTKFSNPHGLQNAMNVSSPKDLIILSTYVTKN